MLESMYGKISTKTNSVGRYMANDIINNQRKQRQCGHNEYHEGNNNSHIETSRSPSEDICSMGGSRDESASTSGRNQQVLVGPHYNSSLAGNYTLHYFPDCSPQPIVSCKPWKKSQRNQNRARMLFNNGNINDHFATGANSVNEPNCKNYLITNGQLQQQNHQLARIENGSQQITAGFMSDTNAVQYQQQQQRNNSHQFSAQLNNNDSFDARTITTQYGGTNYASATTVPVYRQPPSAHCQSRGVKRHSDSSTKRPPNSNHRSITESQSSAVNSNDIPPSSSHVWAAKAQNLNKANSSLGGAGTMGVDQAASGSLRGTISSGPTGAASGGSPFDEHEIQNENNEDNINEDEGRDQEEDDDCEAEGECDEEINYEPILTKILNEKKLILASSPEVIRFICGLHQRSTLPMGNNFTAPNSGGYSSSSNKSNLSDDLRFED